MYLKRLELRGFKSFADKTLLEFEPGIAAVVGPNGSGKSNLADAALWALGEQNPRVLRGESTEDIIFGGSTLHPPLGLAEVSLTLDNGDGLPPLEFSEVTITRRALPSGECDYFVNGTPCRLLDIQELLSRFGLGREMVTVISQGRLEEILNGHPQDRKAVIERAAGIFRYKWRKEKALKKLLSLKEKVLRVQDILKEINRALSPLKKQAALSELHQRFSSELKEAEVTLAVIELKNLQKQWESGKEKKRDQQGKISSLKEKLASYQRKADEFQASLEERVLGKEIENKHRLQALIAEIEKNLSLLGEKEKFLGQRLKEASEIAQNLLREAENEAKKISQIEEKKKSADINQSRLYQRLNEARHRAEVLKKKRVTTEENLKLKKKELEEFPPEEPRLSLNFGPAEAGKFLGDLIQVLPPYERAIQTVLGKDLLGVVVEDFKEIESILTHLKEGKGKATFFPLKEQRESPRITPPPGTILATDVVKVKSPFKPLIQALLGQVCIVENLSKAQQLRPKLPHLTYVTLEGIVLSPEGRVKVDFGDRHLSPSKKRLLEEELEQLHNQRRAYLQEETAATEGISRLQVELASLRERRIYLEREYTGTKEHLQELKRAEYEERKRILSFQSLQKRTQAIPELLVNLLQTTRNWGAKFESSLKNRENQFKQGHKDLRETQITMRKLSEEIGSAEKEFYEASLSLAQLGAKVKAVVEKIVEGYGVPLEKAVERGSKSLSEDEVRPRIEKLKEKMAGLGPINPLAIEEAKALEKRHQFFTQQVEDLLNSKKALDKIVRAIDGKIAQQFFNAFEKVNFNFQSLFSEVFPGGKAELSLTSNDSDEGIEIMAQPPGKKLRKLSLLSGGEKALLALTFLFAVYLTNPAPFYVLDEVEPALDELNLQKFISLMERLKKKTQFLIITHQRRTMEIADSLWGVTIDGGGTSKVFSLRSGFIPASEEPN